MKKEKKNKTEGKHPEKEKKSKGKEPEREKDKKQITHLS